MLIPTNSVPVNLATCWLKHTIFLWYNFLIRTNSLSVVLTTWLLKKALLKAISGETCQCMKKTVAAWLLAVLNSRHTNFNIVPISCWFSIIPFSSCLSKHDAAIYIAEMASFYHISPQHPSCSPFSAIHCFFLSRHSSPPSPLPPLSPPPPPPTTLPEAPPPLPSPTLLPLPVHVNMAS